jgi:hypothetical protein
MACSDRQERTQRLMLATWLVEMNLAKLNSLEDGRSPCGDDAPSGMLSGRKEADVARTRCPFS